MITIVLMQQKNKKYDLKFKLSVVKYVEENLSEAASRCFSVDPKRVKDGRKSQTELQRLSEEDSNRARLPGGMITVKHQYTLYDPVYCLWQFFFLHGPLMASWGGGATAMNQLWGAQLAKC